MKIFKDVLSGDEMLSDAFVLKEVDGIFYEVEGETVTEKTTVDESLIGGNKSAEDTGVDDVADKGVTGINIVFRHQLQHVGKEYKYTKKDYKAHIKKYMKKISEHLAKENPCEVEKFKKDASVAVAKLLAKFDDLRFFRGESHDPDMDEGECMLAVVEYRDGTPYMLFFKHGLVGEKV